MIKLIKRYPQGSHKTQVLKGKRSNRTTATMLRMYEQQGLGESCDDAHHEQRGTIFRITPTSKM